MDYWACYVTQRRGGGFRSSDHPGRGFRHNLLARRQERFYRSSIAIKDKKIELIDDKRLIELMMRLHVLRRSDQGQEESAALRCLNFAWGVWFEFENLCERPPQSP